MILHYISRKKAVIESIPQGVYCFDAEGLCPYWAMDKTKPYQENGYCHFLKKGDWELDHFGLLWDQCKECTMFREINEYDYTIKNNLQKFFIKFFLWNSIERCYNIKEKIKILFTGKICRCKICKKYFLTTNESHNVTMCYSCFYSNKRNFQSEKKEKVQNE